MQNVSAHIDDVELKLIEVLAEYIKEENWESATVIHRSTIDSVLQHWSTEPADDLQEERWIWRSRMITFTAFWKRYLWRGHLQRSQKISSRITEIEEKQKTLQQEIMKRTNASKSATSIIPMTEQLPAVRNMSAPWKELMLKEVLRCVKYERECRYVMEAPQIISRSTYTRKSPINKGFLTDNFYVRESSVPISVNIARTLSYGMAALIQITHWGSQFSIRTANLRNYDFCESRIRFSDIHRKLQLLFHMSTYINPPFPWLARALCCYSQLSEWFCRFCQWPARCSYSFTAFSRSFTADWYHCIACLSSGCEFKTVLFPESQNQPAFEAFSAVAFYSSARPLITEKGFIKSMKNRSSLKPISLSCLLFPYLHRYIGHTRHLCLLLLMFGLLLHKVHIIITVFIISSRSLGIHGQHAPFAYFI